MEITISRLKEIIKEEIGSYKNDVLLETPAHFCATHVRENATGRAGRCIDHNWNETLQEVTAYDVDFGNEIVENVPVSELTILEAKNESMHGGHMAKRDEDEVLDEEAIELDEEVEDLEEIAAKRYGNEDRDQGRNRMLPDRLHEEEEEEKKSKVKTFEPEGRMAKPEKQEKRTGPSKSLEKAARKAMGRGGETIEEAITSQVDKLLIEMGLMQPRKPLTLEEQIASLVDNFMPKLNEKELEEKTFAYEQKEEVTETKKLGDTIREAVEEAIKSVTEDDSSAKDKYSNPKDMPGGKLGGDSPKTPERGPEEKVSLEETEIKTSIKEWYNNEKFEALKNKWAK